MFKEVITIGTRQSELAMAQSETVRQSLLKRFPGRKFELLPVTTTGDLRRDRLNLNVEDKKQWVIEIEHLLLSGEVDIAVHSAKDVPINIENGTDVRSVLRREDSRDVMIVRSCGIVDSKNPLSSLPRGCKIGTSSKRRRAQILLSRPDIEVIPFRGNVNKRIEKLNADETLTAIILAAAGVNRLSLDKEKVIPIDHSKMLSAVGQGQLLAQYLKVNETIAEMISAISETEDQYCYETERKLIEVLGADCHSSVGVKANLLGEEISLECIVLSSDGKESIREKIVSKLPDRLKSAEILAKSLIEKGAKTLLMS